MAITGTTRSFTKVIHGPNAPNGGYKDIPNISVSFKVTPQRSSHSSAALELKFSDVKVKMEAVSGHNYTFGFYIRTFVSNNNTDMSIADVQTALSNDKHVNEWQTGSMRLATIMEEEAEAGGVEWELPFSFPGKGDDGVFTFGNVTDNSANITVYLKTQAGCPECDAGPGPRPANDNVGSISTTNSFTIEAADIPDYWTSITKGDISITDNGNNTFTVSGKNGKGGFNNALNSGTLNTVLGIEGVSFSLVDVSTNDPLAGKTDEDDFSRTYRISDPDDKIGDAGVIKVTSTITNVPSQSADGTVVDKDEKVIKFYKVPNPPTSIWYVSNGKSSASDGTFKPRLKDELSWRWTGASPGNKSSSITGYKIYIYKNEVDAGADGTAFYLTAPSSEADSSITNEPSDNGTPGHKIETNLTSDTRLNFKFIPKDEGFVNNDKCICRVFSGTTWGDNSIHYSAGRLGECILKNGAVVWIKIPKPDDPDTLEWKEGTVYIHNGSTWKEAEGVYVHDGSGWEEAT
jgi:hypothetical protein